MGQKWWAVFKKRERGDKAKSWDGAHGEAVDAVMKPPVLSIQAAPLKESETRGVSIAIYELDSFDEKRSADDMVAIFEGEISRQGGRFYFEPSEYKPVTNPKPGPKIDFYFEAPGGKLSKAYPVVLTGDELEIGEWELGWQILPPGEKAVTSKSLVRIRHSDYTSGPALERLRSRCIEYLNLMYQALDAAGWNWKAYASQYANAYHKAYAKVTDVLKKAEKDASQDTFLKELVFEMLSMASGGALERIFKWAKGGMTFQVVKEITTKKGKIKVKPVDETPPEQFFEIPSSLTEFYAGKGQDQLKDKWNNEGPKLELEAIDPLEFHLKLSARVDTIFAFYKNALVKANKAMPEDEGEYSNSDLDKIKRGLDTFLVKSAAEKGLKHHVMTLPKANAPFFENENRPDADSVQWRLETGLWSIWLAELERKGDESSLLTKGTLEYAPPPPRVRDRLRAIGVLKRAGIDLAKLDEAIKRDQSPGASAVSAEDHFWAIQGNSLKLIEWARKWEGKEAVENGDVFNQTEPTRGLSKEPTGVWTRTE